MTTDEMAELFLLHLYNLSEAAPHPNFLFSVNDFAPAFGVSKMEDLEKALNYLGDKGLVIMAGFDSFGGISAGITMEGSILVEKGGQTGIIPKYRMNPGNFISSTTAPILTNTVPKKIPTQSYPFPKRSIDALILDMEDILQSDMSLAESTKTDAIADLAALKAQITRTKINFDVVKALVDILTGFVSIHPLMKALSLVLSAQFEYSENQ